MQDDSIFSHPMRRRWWLINKALESASLDDALKIAQAADEFITSGELQRFGQEFPKIIVENMTKTTDIEDGNSKSTLDSPVSWPINEPNLFKQDEDSRPITLTAAAIIDKSLPDDAQTEHDAAETSVGQPDFERIGSNGAADLAVWASIEDVIRYLRQRDDVVVPTGDGKFLVNGRFSEDVSALVCRANRARGRQGKPPFQLVPAGFAAA